MFLLHLLYLVYDFYNKYNIYIKNLSSVTASQTSNSALSNQVPKGLEPVEYLKHNLILSSGLNRNYYLKPKSSNVTI